MGELNIYGHVSIGHSTQSNWTSNYQKQKQNKKQQHLEDIKI